MGRYSHYDDYGFAPYVSVAEKRARNREAAAKLQKKSKAVQPVTIDGRTIATTWWGKSWNANLERYADYSNRIGRGRSYVRHGAVLDLQIVAGTVNALVQGSRGSPYEVTVSIDKLPSRVWKELREESLRQVDSLSDLLAGQFPTALKDTFFAQGTGLFPAPKEISFDCSCPDWATMCKHVAAVLYGIGNRLDSAPELLFTLRQVTVDDLIAHTVDAAAEGLISKAEQADGDDVLAGADLGDMFGIELDSNDIPAIDLPAPSGEPDKEKKRTEAESGKKKSIKATASARQSSPKAKATRPPKLRKKSGSAKANTSGRNKRHAKGSKPEPGRMLEQLVSALGQSRRCFNTADLVEKLPAWTRLQVTNTLQRAISQGLVERAGRGVYRRV